MSMYGAHEKLFNKKGERIFPSPVLIDPDPEIIIGRHRNNPGQVVRQGSLTVQSDAAEADINALVAKYGLNQVYAMKVREGQYMDLSNAPDYLEAQNRIVRANEAFALLSASVRSRFNNDPAQFLDFIHDPDNVDEAVKLGLAVRAPEPKVPGPAGSGAAAPQPAPGPAPKAGGKGGAAPQDGAV